VTYNLSPCWDGSGVAEWLRHTVNFAVVWALAVVGPEAPVIVLDWQHPAYRFWPHRNRTFDNGQLLAGLTPVPDGDYYVFVTEDLHLGTFGHPWEASLCVFGSPLVDKLQPILDALLPRLRSNR
jgi:hypothetical protein